MEVIAEFFIEILFRRLIVRFFGYYTLFFLYKLFRNKEGLEWLESAAKHEGEEFGKGCLISLAGFVSFAIIISLIVWIFYGF